MQGSQLPVYTLAQVAKHCSPDDAWLVIDGDVYDVTSFLSAHPGGPEIVEEYLGQDATAVFKTEEGHEHSQAAVDMLPPLRVGTIDPDRRPIGLEITEGAMNDPRIDWSKPLVFQVGLLGKDYQRWVHSPIHTDKPVVMLGGWMEPFTKVQWWVPLVFWVPVIVYFMRHALWSGELSWPVIALLWTAAFACWPFLEYGLHRWVYHVRTESYWMNTLHFLMHGVHHLTPMDKTRLVAPPPLAVFIATPILTSLYLFSPSLSFSMVVASGLLCGYLIYDEMHFYLHHGKPSFHFLQELKRHHNDHHYRVPDWDFGVSNYVTDVVFDTLR